MSLHEVQAPTAAGVSGPLPVCGACGHSIAQHQQKTGQCFHSAGVTFSATADFPMGSIGRAVCLCTKFREARA